MIILIITLSALLSFLLAYTTKIQRGTLIVGRLLAGQSGDAPGTGIQDAITSVSHSLRQYSCFALMILVFVVTVISYRWYIGFLPIICSIFLSGLIKVLPGLTPSPKSIVSGIKSGLEDRYQTYLQADDPYRAQATRELLDRLNRLSLEEVTNLIK